MKKRVTMKDIADAVGVSTVAVSKALAGKDGISDRLRAKIKETAEEMGYTHSQTVKRPANGLSGNIGIIVAECFIKDDSFYFKYFNHLSKYLQMNGFYAFFHTLSYSNEENLVLPKIYYENRVDGFIILGQVSKKYSETVLATGRPVVFLDFYDDNINVDCVIFNSFYSSYELTSYLVTNGHREIAFIGNIHATSSIQDRYLGYYKSLIEHRLPLRDEYLISDRTDNGMMIPLVLPDKMPTAFVCNCDEVACRLIIQLKEQGYRVPQDISVVGFDNSVYSTISEPNITTFEVNTDEMSKLAVDVILKKIDNSDTSYGRMHVDGSIVYKSSVANAKT